MLATLNDKQNDPHDVIDISPDVVLASRMDKEAPSLAPEITSGQEPKIELAPDTAGAAPSVDKAVRAALRDYRAARKRSSVGKWLRGGAFSVLLAAGSTAAAIAWQAHGDALKESVSAWMPSLAFAASPSQAAQVAADAPAATTPAATTPQAAPADQPAPEAAPPIQPQDAAATRDTSPAPPTATTPDATQTLQSMAHDLAAMGQQIEQLKANIAELKAGQEQMAREMSKPPPAKPAEARSAPPHARLSALPPRPPTASAHRTKPVLSPAYTPAYAPAPIASPPPQAAAAPPAPPPPRTADDDGPVVRPPMPLR